MKTATKERAQAWIGSLRGLAQRVGSPWRDGDTLIERRRAIVEEVAGLLVAIGGGRRVLPFGGVGVELLAATPDERALLESACAGGWSDDLAAELAARLEERGCERRVEVEVLVRDLAEGETAPRPYRLSYRRERVALAEPGAAPAVVPEPKPNTVPLRLVVLRGEAEHDSYRFDQDRILIGRLTDVFDGHGLLVRRNDLVFRDDGEINLTVSREQARIERRGDDYWLVDGCSAHGTRIFRDGRPIEVSSRDRRGVRLRNGDEVYLGRAALRCELGG
jgi:hypothetical protein